MGLPIAKEAVVVGKLCAALFGEAESAERKSATTERSVGCGAVASAFQSF